MSDGGTKSGKTPGGGAAAASAGRQAKPGARLVPLRPRRQCPICGKKATQATYPFCSLRCADIDLDRWLSGRYRVAGSADDDDTPRPQTPPASRSGGDAADND